MENEESDIEIESIHSDEFIQDPSVVSQRLSGLGDSSVSIHKRIIELVKSVLNTQTISSLVEIIKPKEFYLGSDAEHAYRKSVYSNQKVLIVIFLFLFVVQTTIHYTLEGVVQGNEKGLKNINKWIGNHVIETIIFLVFQGGLFLVCAIMLIITKNPLIQEAIVVFLMITNGLVGFGSAFMTQTINYLIAVTITSQIVFNMVDWNVKWIYFTGFLTAFAVLEYVRAPGILYVIGDFMEFFMVFHFTMEVLLFGNLTDRRHFLVRHIILKNNQKLKLQIEQSKILLENMLPKNVYKKIEKSEKLGKFFFEELSNHTVVFVKIVDFNILLDGCTEYEIISILNNVFGKFDDIIRKNRFSRISTIRENYLFTSGLTKTKQRKEMILHKTIRICGEIIKFLELSDIARNIIPEGVKVRIGINQGKFVCAAIGNKGSYSMDVYGDTINVASRLSGANKKNNSLYLLKNVYDPYIGFLKEINEENTTFDNMEEEIVTLKGKGEMECVNITIKYDNLKSMGSKAVVSKTSSDLSGDSSFFSDGSSSTGSKKKEGIKRLLRVISLLKKDTEYNNGIGNKWEDKLKLKDKEGSEKIRKKKQLLTKLLGVDYLNEEVMSEKISHKLHIKFVNPLFLTFKNPFLNEAFFWESFYQENAKSNRLISCFSLEIVVAAIFFDLFKMYSYDSSLLFVTWYQIFWRLFLGVAIMIIATIPMFLRWYKTNFWYNLIATQFHIAGLYAFQLLYLSFFGTGDYDQNYGLFLFTMVACVISSFQGQHVFIKIFNLLFIFVLSLLLFLGTGTKNFSGEYAIRDFVSYIAEILNSVFIVVVTVTNSLAMQKNSMTRFLDENLDFGKGEKLSVMKERSNQILTQVLPQTIIDKLLTQSDKEVKDIADFYETLSICCSDIHNFTTISSGLTALQVVEMINKVFCGFDKILQSFGIYRAKIIGDAYVFVLGSVQHQRNMALCTLDLLTFVKTDLDVEIRFGIHEGSAVAGIIGKTRFAYDYYGRSVVIAEEYENTGKSNCIHVSKKFAKSYSHRNVEEYSFRRREDQIVIDEQKVVSYWMVKNNKREYVEL